MKSADKRKFYILVLILVMLYQNCSDSNLTSGSNSPNNFKSLNFQGIIGQSATISQSGGASGGGSGGSTSGGGSSGPLPSPIASVLSGRIIVADPHGTPSGNGTAASPVDLFTARDLAAAVIKASDSGPVKILLNCGTYFLPQPWVFTATNSGTTNSPILVAPAQSNCMPVLTGSLTLNLNDPSVQTSQVSLDSVSGIRTVWRVTASGALGAQLNTAVQHILATSNGGAFSVGQVFQDGTPLIRSRHPNSTSVIYNEYEQNQGATAEVWFPSSLGISNWQSNLQDGQTEVTFTNDYNHFRGVISGVGGVSGQTPMNQTWSFVHFDEALRQNQPNGSSINPVAELMNAAPPSNYYESGWLENNKIFVDSSGEWYFDSKEMALYVIPNGTPSSFDLSLGYNLIEFQGQVGQPVSNLTFTNLRFQNTNWRYATGTGLQNPRFYSFGQAAYGLEGAIDGNYVQNVTISNNSFYYTGASGIAINGCRTSLADGNCSQNPGIAILNNQFNSVGGSAITYDDRSANTPVQSQIQNNTISNPGQIFWDAPGINILQSNNLVVSYNNISNTPYSAIAAGWRCDSFPNSYIGIMHNTITHAMMTLTDGGDIYSTGSHGEVGYNTFDKAGANRTNGFSPPPYAQFDLYFDSYQTYWAIHDNTQVTGNGVVLTKSTTTSIFNMNGRGFQTFIPYWSQEQQSQWNEYGCAVSSINGSTSFWNTPGKPFAPNWWNFPKIQTISQ